MPASIRTTSSRFSRDGENSEVTISNITEEEAKKIQAFVFGNMWVSVEHGRLIFRDKMLPLPDPVEDEAMLPFWKKQGSGSQLHLFDPEWCEKSSSPSIIIHSLCGYNYTPENYKHEAEKLERFGFTQMRSKRGDDGRFSEHWVLHGMIFAQDELKEFITETKEKIETKHSSLTYEEKEHRCFDEVLSFLARKVSFGSLEISEQRYAMVMD